jgi:hypothetical protein
MTVVAIGNEQFQVADKILSMSDIAGLTVGSRLAADSAGCRHELRFGVVAGLSASESEDARRRLNELKFRILSIGVVKEH